MECGKKFNFLKLFSRQRYDFETRIVSKIHRKSFNYCKTFSKPDI